MLLTVVGATVDKVLLFGLALGLVLGLAVEGSGSSLSELTSVVVGKLRGVVDTRRRFVLLPGRRRLLVVGVARVGEVVVSVNVVPRVLAGLLGAIVVVLFLEVVVLVLVLVGLRAVVVTTGDEVG